MNTQISDIQRLKPYFAIDDLRYFLEKLGISSASFWLASSRNDIQEFLVRMAD